MTGGFDYNYCINPIKCPEGIAMYKRVALFRLRKAINQPLAKMLPETV